MKTSHIKHCNSHWLKQSSFPFKKWQKFKEMTAEKLEQAKQEILSIEERLSKRMPERPLETVKELKSRVKDVMK